MNLKVIAPAFAALALALVAPAAQAGCDGLEGKELKTCEKKEKALAKANARSTPYLPSTLDAKLSGWDGDTNPFATEEYRVRVTPTEIASVDDYLGKAFRINAIVVMSRYVVDEVGKGNTDAIAAIPVLVPLLTEVPTLGQQLVQEGQGLVTSLPSQLAGPDALKLPKVLPALKDGVGSLQGAVNEAPQVLDSLKSVAANPSAAAGAAAGMGADAATGAATEAVEGATNQ